MRSPVIIAFLLLPIYGQAQVYGQRLSIGIQASGTISAILNQQNYGQNEMLYRIPFNFGLGVPIEYRVAKKFSLVTGVSFLRLGQNYEDNFKRQHYYRGTDLNYFTAPLLGKWFPGRRDAACASGSATGRPQYYLIGGVQAAVLSSVRLVWEIDEQRTDFITFITEGGNANQELIDMNGRPANDEDLFSRFDLQLVGGIGVQADVQSYITLFGELRGGLGIFDINAQEWQLPNINGNYFASRNAFFGLYAGVAFRIR